MTRIKIPRGSAGLTPSSNQNKSPPSVPVLSPSSAASPEQQLASITQIIPAVKDDNLVDEEKGQIVLDELSEHCGDLGRKGKGRNGEELSPGSLNCDHHEEETIENNEKVLNDDGMGSGNSVKGVGWLSAVEGEVDSMVGSSFQVVINSSDPPPLPVPPPKPSSMNSSSKRFASGDLNTEQIGSSRRPIGWPGVSSSSSPTGSRPSSPQSHCEGEGYNSADEQRPCFGSSCDKADREHQFEVDLKQVKGLEVRKMLADGNCLFRAVADQVYGDSELYNLVRQLCIDYMEQNADHFAEFITEDFTSYCERKRINKAPLKSMLPYKDCSLCEFSHRLQVYGNNMEIQALSEMYNRPIHIYSYSSEPINIFHGSYRTDVPPIRLSYHHGNHYNSLVDPNRPTTGAGLGFSSLQGTNLNKDQVKAAIKAQQDQQVNNALLAEGRLYSDIECTEREIERMVMEASRAEYLAGVKFKQQLGYGNSSTCVAEPSSSGARSSRSDSKKGEREFDVVAAGTGLGDSIHEMLSMGFSDLQVIEAYSIFGDNVDSMVDYLIESSSKGKAAK